MKVKTLIILSIVFFAVGTLGGAAYALVSGGTIDILPTAKTSEEKMIDQFIAEQEKKQDDNPTPNQATGAEESEKSSQDNDLAPSEPDEQEPSSTTVNTNTKRMGQPTVSDGKTLRVRATPDAQKGEVLLGISNTEKVEIIGEQNGWYQIITSNGTKGWVSAEYMKEL